MGFYSLSLQNCCALVSLLRKVPTELASDLVILDIVILVQRDNTIDRVETVRNYVEQ